MKQDSKHPLHSNDAHSHSSSSRQLDAGPSTTAKVATSASSTSLDSETQRRLSPMLDFLRKKRNARNSGDNDVRTALKDKHKIDPTDGKTRACDRTRTFDTFVDGEQLGEATQEKRAGHSWELFRALAKLKKVFRKGDAKGKVSGSAKGG